MFAFHDFAHPKYTQLVVSPDRADSQLPLG
jgi:hypothetical protein